MGSLGRQNVWAVQSHFEYLDWLGEVAQATGHD